MKSEMTDQDILHSAGQEKQQPQTLQLITQPTSSGCEKPRISNPVYRIVQMDSHEQVSSVSSDIHMRSFTKQELLAQQKPTAAIANMVSTPILTLSSNAPAKPLYVVLNANTAVAADSSTIEVPGLNIATTAPTMLTVSQALSSNTLPSVISANISPSRIASQLSALNDKLDTNTHQSLEWQPTSAFSHLEGKFEPMHREDRRRLSHNEVERRRRDKINHWIATLAERTPECRNNLRLQQSKSGVLSKACDYIEQLEDRVTSMTKKSLQYDKLANELNRVRALCKHQQTAINNLLKALKENGITIIGVSIPEMSENLLSEGVNMLSSTSLSTESPMNSKIKIDMHNQKETEDHIQHRQRVYDENLDDSSTSSVEKKREKENLNSAPLLLPCPQQRHNNQNINNAELAHSAKRKSIMPVQRIIRSSSMQQKYSILSSPGTHLSTAVDKITDDQHSINASPSDNISKLKNQPPPTSSSLFPGKTSITESDISSSSNSSQKRYFVVSDQVTGSQLETDVTDSVATAKRDVTSVDQMKQDTHKKTVISEEDGSVFIVDPQSTTVEKVEVSDVQVTEPSSKKIKIN